MAQRVHADLRVLIHHELRNRAQISERSGPSARMRVVSWMPAASVARVSTSVSVQSEWTTPRIFSGRVSPHTSATVGTLNAHQWRAVGPLHVTMRRSALSAAVQVSSFLKRGCTAHRK